MEDPLAEIKNVVSLFTAAASPEIQATAIKRYMTPDAGFRHPLCNVTPGPRSRERVLGIYQWYRILSPTIEISVSDITHNADTNVLVLDATQYFHVRLSPFKPAPSRLLVRLTLREIDGLWYIAFQEDFYHPDDFMALLVPPFSPVIRTALSLTATASDIYAKVGQLFGFWSVHDVGSTAGLYDDKRAD